MSQIIPAANCQDPFESGQIQIKMVQCQRSYTSLSFLSNSVTNSLRSILHLSHLNTFLGLSCFTPLLVFIQ